MGCKHRVILWPGGEKILILSYDEYYDQVHLFFHFTAQIQHVFHFNMQIQQSFEKQNSNGVQIKWSRGLHSPHLWLKAVEQNEPLS